MILLELKPNHADSIAHAIRHACEPLTDPAAAMGWGGQFNIGELAHYFEAVLPEQFDCYGVPETYPFGL